MIRFAPIALAALLAAPACKTATDAAETPVQVLEPAGQTASPEGGTEGASGETPYASAEWPSDERIVAELRRTPCFGKCPVDLLVIWDDGTVRYAGQQNVDRLGTWRGQLAPGALDAVLDRARKLGFWTLEETYPSGGMRITDLPSEVIRLVDGEREHRVVNRRYANPDVAGEQAVVEGLNGLSEALVALLDGAGLRPVGEQRRD